LSGASFLAAVAGEPSTAEAARKLAPDNIADYAAGYTVEE
jgi:hypothetical protein